MINKVEISGVDTSHLPVLSIEENQMLLKQIKAGNLEARKKFINGNLKLVLSLIKRFKNSNSNADDLFQIGCIGLIKAIDNFDLSQNVQFSTYAVPMILGEIRRYLRDNNPIRVSRSIRNLAYKSLMVKEHLLKTSKCEPTIEQISKIVGESKEAISASLDAIQDPVSLQESIHCNSDNDNLYIMDQISDKKNTEEVWANSITIMDALNRLSKREKNIIQKRFFDCKTQMEVASEIGISQAQVSRLEKDAINHIRKHYNGF